MRAFAQLLLLAVVLPALLLSAIVLLLGARAHRADVAERLAAATESSAQNISDVLHGHLAVIQVLAERRSRGGDTADLDAWRADVARVHRYFPQFRSVFVTDARGRVLASDPAGLRADAPADIAFRPHFQAARADGQARVSDVFRAQLFGTEARVSAVAPVFERGRFAGAVIGSLGADAFADMQGRRLRERGLELLVLDRERRVVHASEGLLPRALDALDARIDLATLESPGTQRLPGLLRDGGDAYAHAKRLPTGWHVVVVMPVATLQAALRGDALVMLGLLAVVVLGVLLIVWLQSRQQARSLQALLARMQRFALGGGADGPIAPAGGGFPAELAPLSAALASLSARVGEAYAETGRSLARQRQLREELQAMAHKLMRVQEDERQVLSRELHDDVGQAITAIKLGAMALADEDPDGQRAIAAEIVATADQTIAKLRNLSLLLRPPQLDALGLEAALQGQVDLLSRGGRTAISLRVEPLPVRPSPEVELACFRVAQEALTNALRHAQAGRVWISVDPSEGGLLLEVRDDGAGLVEGARAGLGLVTMRERTQLVGGRFEIESVPGEGSCVRAWMPLAPAAGADAAGAAD